MRLLGSVCVVVLLSASVAYAQDSKSTGTPAELQGVWKVVQRVYSHDNANTASVGKVLTGLGYALDLGNGKLTRKDDDEDEGEGAGSALTFAYDDTKSPHTIDITLPGKDDDKSGQTLYGIYKVDCGVLSIAVGNGATRPTTFDDHLNQVLLILKKPGTTTVSSGG